MSLGNSHVLADSANHASNKLAIVIQISMSHVVIIIIRTVITIIVVVITFIITHHLKVIKEQYTMFINGGQA